MWVLSTESHITVVSLRKVIKCLIRNDCKKETHISVVLAVRWDTKDGDLFYHGKGVCQPMFIIVILSGECRLMFFLIKSFLVLPPKNLIVLADDVSLCV